MVTTGPSICLLYTLSAQVNVYSPFFLLSLNDRSYNYFFPQNNAQLFDSLLSAAAPPQSHLLCVGGRAVGACSARGH